MGLYFDILTLIYITGYVVLAITFKGRVELDPALVALGLATAIDMLGEFQFMVRTTA